MIFSFPNLSSVYRAFPKALTALVITVFSAVSMLAAPLLVLTDPGAKATFKADSEGAETIELGVADADGLLLVSTPPASAGTMIFTHPDAELPSDVAYVPGKTPGKFKVELKLKPASLLISALPADEVEIFVDGKHRGRGAVTLGGLDPRKKITVEARSARRGMQSRVVSVSPGETLPVKFDLRGNEASSSPDGQIVLPELPLVLASQPGATLKADGANVVCEDGILRGLKPGERVIEIFLPWKGRQVCVWRAAMPARSAMLPGSDVVSMPNPVRETPAKKEEAQPPVVPGKSGAVLFAIGSRVTVELGSNAGLKDGQTVNVYFGDAQIPVSVSVSGVTPSQSIFTLPEGVLAPKDGVICRIEESETPNP